jgi:hypothetical protein
MSGHDDDHGDGDTLKVTDDYLMGIALNQIKSFLDDLQVNKAVIAVNGFADAGGGVGIAGEYSKLLPGEGRLDSAKNLQARFTSLCVSLRTELNALGKTMKDISVDLQGAHTKLGNGADEALSAAEMMSVLDGVIGGGVKPPVRPPTT